MVYIYEPSQTVRKSEKQYRKSAPIAMNPGKLVETSRNLIVQPGEEWKSLDAEKLSTGRLTRQVVIPYAILVALCAMIGSLFTYQNTPFDSFYFLLINALIVFGIVTVYTWLSGRIIHLLARNIHPGNTARSSYKLLAFSQVPFYLVLAFVKLFPSLVILMVLGFYTIYLFWLGTDTLLRIPSGKKVQFVILSSLLMIMVFILTSEISRVFYLYIVEQFTTFDVQSY